jgi:hypothetical protein
MEPSTCVLIGLRCVFSVKHDLLHSHFTNSSVSIRRRRDKNISCIVHPLVLHFETFDSSGHDKVVRKEILGVEEPEGEVEGGIATNSSCSKHRVPGRTPGKPAFESNPAVATKVTYAIMQLYKCLPSQLGKFPYHFHRHGRCTGRRTTCK